MASLFQSVYRTSTVAAPVYILPTVWQGLLCSTPSPVFIVCGLSNDGRLVRCEVTLPCRFYLHSLIISHVEHLFNYLLVLCMSSLEESPFKSTNFLTGLFVFELYKLKQ